MTNYVVVWRDSDDGSLFEDDEFDEPDLAWAAMIARNRTPPNMILVSVREAGYARETEMEYE